MTDGGYLLSSLEAGIKVLRMFHAHDRVSVSEAAQSLGIARSQAHRILRTLESSGYVSLSASGRGFVPGPALLDLAAPRLGGRISTAMLREALRDAVDRTGATVHIARLTGTRLLFMDGLRGAEPDAIGLRSGTLRPAHATTAGKLLLSYFDDIQLRLLYPQESLRPLTPWTVPTRSLLLGQVARIRRTRVAQSYQESVRNLNGVAVHIAGESWVDRIALVASIPAAPDGGHRELDAVARELRTVAETVSAA